MPLTGMLQVFGLRLMAKAALMAGRNEAALTRFDQILDCRPLDPHALASRAHLLGQRGDRAGAIETLYRLTAAHPEHAAGWFNLGFLLEEAGVLEPAREAFQCACELAPDLDRAWFGLAQVHIRAGRLDEAAAALQVNTRLQPFAPHGWYQLARLHVQRQANEEAIRIIDHLRGFEPRVAAQLERETGLQASR